MIADKDWKAKLKLLDDLSMRYEVAVKPLYEEDYLKEFYDFYEIKNRKAKLVPAGEGFEETLKNVSGECCWEAIAAKTESLFGLPVRVTVFNNNAKLREELEGPEGLAPFFFVFDLMFCEYGEYTLCFISGSNNQKAVERADCRKYDKMIIDAHMHYFKIDGFDELARLADHENSRQGWQEICEANQIAFSVAMGNSYDAPCRFGGVTPRLINLGEDPFCVQPYNQPDNVGYCLGVQSEEITPDNAEKTAMEFEYYLQRDPHCLGIKFYMGYQNVYLYDPRHDLLFELAKAYDVPVAMHSGETANHHGRLRYSHPLTVDEAACRHTDVRFVICHMGNPWIVDAFEVASKNENVFMDFSGLWEHRLTPEREQEIEDFQRYVRMWLNYHGIWDKIMYGSDWPLINIPDNIRNLGRIVPEIHWDEFYYDNALRVYSRIKKIKIVTDS